MYKACISMCLMSSLFFHTIGKNCCLLINTFQSDYFHLAPLALQIIYIIPTYHYTAKTEMEGPLRVTMFLLPPKLSFLIKMRTSKVL